MTDLLLMLLIMPIDIYFRLHYSRLVPEFKESRWPDARACWEPVQGRRSDAILLRSGRITVYIEVHGKWLSLRVCELQC